MQEFVCNDFNDSDKERDLVCVTCSLQDAGEG